MSKKSSDLTMEAIKGYQTDFPANPYLRSSPNWFAYELGAYLRRTGYTLPRDVRMGRGYRLHSNDMLFAFDARCTIARVS